MKMAAPLVGHDFADGKRPFDRFSAVCALRVDRAAKFAELVEVLVMRLLLCAILFCASSASAAEGPFEFGR
jgi:hypothetical protein